MKKISKICSFLLICLIQSSCQEKVSKVWLDELPMFSYAEGIRPVKMNVGYMEDSIRIGGVVYPRGIGTITHAIFTFDVDGNARRFTASMGPDDHANTEIAQHYYVLGDRKILFESPAMKPGDKAIKVDVNLKGIRRVGLLITDEVGGQNNRRTYCNIANACFEMIPGSMVHPVVNRSQPYILTPPSSKQPQIHSPKVFGATPGNPFLYTIAATGARPLQFGASGLPKGLVLDKTSGIITGRVANKGDYPVIISAKNEWGEASGKLMIRIGDTIALTPPMGWNGWNSWGDQLDKEKVLASADAIVSKGLKDHGWSYVNVDDTWQGVRGGSLNALQPNEKFGDIKGMVDHIHSLGLKAGIYSTPYIYSYAGYIGASSEFEKGGETCQPDKKKRTGKTLIGPYRFETNDARQMAEWGFDFLKYDWRIDTISTERMSKALKQSGRDIVFSISNNAPFEKAATWARLTNAWRTGADIKDSWNSLYSLAFTIDKWAPFAGPGHWNDPDMLILGNVSMGPSKLHPTRLTPDEQYSHISLFSLLAAPLLIGCPVEQMDEFTLSLLSNDEVIAVNQDPLGKPARLIADKDGVQIWAKPLEDGSLAVGLFNTANFATTPSTWFRWGDEKPKQFTLDLSMLGLKGRQKLRDLWRQKDLGVFEESFKTEINFHGAIMIRIAQAT